MNNEVNYDYFDYETKLDYPFISWTRTSRNLR